MHCIEFKCSVGHLIRSRARVGVALVFLFPSIFYTLIQFSISSMLWNNIILLWIQESCQNSGVIQLTNQKGGLRVVLNGSAGNMSELTVIVVLVPSTRRRTCIPLGGEVAPISSSVMSLEQSSKITATSL